jgi:hypothetical protein
MPFGGKWLRRCAWIGFVLVLAGVSLHGQVPSQPTIPTITSLATMPPGYDVPTGPAAITTGAESARVNANGFSLYIFGDFNAQVVDSVTWSDGTNTHVFTFGNEDLSYERVVINDIIQYALVATVPTSLFSTAVGTPTPAHIKVTQVVSGSTPTTADSNTMDVTLNPPLGPPSSGLVLPTGVVGVAYSAAVFSGGTGPFQVSLSAGGLTVSNTNLLTGTPPAPILLSLTPTITDVWGTSTSLSETLRVVAFPSISPPTSPSSMPAGSAAFQLTVNGSNFAAPITGLSSDLPGSAVKWTVGSNSTQLATTYVSPTQVTAVVPNMLLGAPGTATITVVEPGTTAESNAATFVITGPGISSINPTSHTAGAAPFTLTVNGANFVTGSQIRFGATLLPTTVVSTGVLTASVTTPTTAGAVTVAAVNPGGIASNSATFTVLPAPAPSSLSPASVTFGATAFTLSVAGANFTNGMSVLWNGQPLATTFVSSTQLNAAVPANLVASAGNAAVSVRTTDGVTSGSLNFVISSPPLSVTTQSPLPTGTVGVIYDTAIIATGGVSPYTFFTLSGNLPDGLQLDGTGRLYGTPTKAGTFTFTLLVNDSASGRINPTFTLTVQSAPVTINTAAGLSGTIGTPFSVTFSASGGSGTGYTFSETGTLPPSAQFTTDGKLTATLTTTGTYRFTVTAKDSAGATGSKDFVLTVTGQVLTITTPPTLPDALAGTPYTDVQFQAAGGQQPYTWSATGVPAGMTLTNSGQISGTPTTAGNNTLAVTVTDGAGTKADGTFTLKVLLAITSKSLPAGAVKVAYTAALTVVGAVGTPTWTVTGLPDGLTADSTGAITGTPHTAGTSSVKIAVADAGGNTASTSFTLTVEPEPLSISTNTIAGGSVGSTYSVTFTATGGTQPYTWSATGIPDGLTFSSDGTLSGTPRGPFNGTITVTVKDGAGVSKSQTVALAILLPQAPPLTFTGVGTSANPGTQGGVSVTIGNAYPVDIAVTLTLAFTADAGGDDPAVQFASGGRTATITIPAGSTSSPTNVGLQFGTVAGTITITAKFTAATQDVTPTPIPKQTIRINSTAPVIVPPITATRTSNGFTVTIVGYSPTRQLTQATFQLTAASGSTLSSSTVTIPVDSLFTAWYQNSASAQYGSQFTYTQPFTISGSPQAVASVSVTLTNSVGTSQSASATLQ